MTAINVNIDMIDTGECGFLGVWNWKTKGGFWNYIYLMSGRKLGLISGTLQLGLISDTLQPGTISVTLFEKLLDSTSCFNSTVEFFFSVLVPNRGGVYHGSRALPKQVQL